MPVVRALPGSLRALARARFGDALFVDSEDEIAPLGVAREAQARRVLVDRADQEREAERDARARVPRDRALDQIVLEAIPDAEPLTRGRVDMEGHELAHAVVHEGRGGYRAIDAGWREYRYPIELVSEGRFCIHYPAGSRLRDQAVHLAALEEMCRAEPEKWKLERRDRGAHRKDATASRRGS